MFLTSACRIVVSEFKAIKAEAVMRAVRVVTDLFTAVCTNTAFINVYKMNNTMSNLDVIVHKLAMTCASIYINNKATVASTCVRTNTIVTVLLTVVQSTGTFINI